MERLKEQQQRREERKAKRSKEQLDTPKESQKPKKKEVAITTRHYICMVPTSTVDRHIGNQTVCNKYTRNLMKIKYKKKG